MGSRGRSIRLRIYILVAIPLITMLGLFGYVAYTSVTNWLNLDRAPTLIQDNTVRSARSRRAAWATPAATAIATAELSATPPSATSCRYSLCAWLNAKS